MKIALLLIALGFGYKVFADASKNTKSSLKNLGRVVGVFMMIVALMGTLCAGYHMVKKNMFSHSSCGSSAYSNCGCAHGKCAHGGCEKGQCSKCAGHGYDSEKKICPFSGKSE